MSDMHIKFSISFYDPAFDLIIVILLIDIRITLLTIHIILMMNSLIIENSPIVIS